MHIVTLNVQEEDAARAWDHVAIAIGRPDADLNFDIINYEDDLDKLKSLSKDEAIKMFLQSSIGHDRHIGQSGYRGVSKTPLGRCVANIWYGFVYVYVYHERVFLLLHIYLLSL